MLELAAHTRRSERPVDHRVERHQALRPVDPGHHPGRHLTAPVPRAQRRAGHPACAGRLVQCHPTLSLGLLGQMGEKAVPVELAAVFRSPVVLRLGHNYIGTEHVLLGVLRAAEAKGSSVVQVLGVGADEVRARVLEVVAKGPAPLEPRSPALVGAMQRARQVAGVAPVTTGQLLLAILADEASQATKALQALGMSADLVEAKLAETPLSTTSDAPPRARAVHIRLGEVTTTIDDPDLAAALGDLTPEQVAAALRSALGPEPGRAAAG